MNTLNSLSKKSGAKHWILRFESSYIYGESILPGAAVKAGAFQLLEIKKYGDKFTGKENRNAVRDDGGDSCAFQISIELTVVTPERIEGRALEPAPNAKIDWNNCSFSSAAEWRNFTWIPVR